MSLGLTFGRAAPLAAALSLTGLAISAHAAEERYPLSARSTTLAAVQSAKPTFTRVGTATAEVPFPRPAPSRNSTRIRGLTAEAASVAQLSDEREAIASTRIAYAAPAEGGFPPSWLTQPVGPVLRPSQGSAAPLVLPDVAALPHLERRYQKGHPATSPTDLIVLIENKAIAHGVPLEWAHAVVRVESNYDPRLTGRGGTLGLMQIKYLTARGMGFKGSAQDLYNPAINLEWGMRYLAGARKLAKGDLCGTVMRYQGGHQASRMTKTSTAYCSKVRTLMGKSSDPTRFAQRTPRR